MSCNGEWTVWFPQTDRTSLSEALAEIAGFLTDPDSSESNSDERDGLEIRAEEMTLKQETDKWDYFRGQFAHEVGEEMKPHTRYEGGALRERQLAVVKLDGEPVQSLLFEPDFVKYGDKKTHITLADLQKTLDSGVVDKRWPAVKAKEAYEYVFDKADTNGLIDGIKFTDIQTLDAELIGQLEFEDRYGTSPGTAENVRAVEDVEASETTRLMEGTWALDFQKKSPARCIQELNKKLGLTSWVDSTGTLWIGRPETNSTRHIAAPDDKRVWRYTDVNVSHGREPVKTVIVWGDWVDEPGVGTAYDWGSWLNPLDGGSVDEPGAEDIGGPGFGDVRAQGVATNTDVDYGQTISYNETSAKHDSLGVVAANLLRQAQKESNKGTIKINPTESGDYTDIRDVGIGDFIHVVPEDGHFDGGVTADSGSIGNEPDNTNDWCEGFVNNEIYLIRSVQHSLSRNGEWTMTLDVVLYPDDSISTGTRYWDPTEQEFKSHDEVFDGDWLESDANEGGGSL